MSNSLVKDTIIREPESRAELKNVRRFFIILILIIYCLNLGIRIYWLSQKDGFYVDEGLSVTLVFYNDYMWRSNYEFNKEYTGKEVKEISLCDNDSFKSVPYDIYCLWKDNRDPAHTNLYYSFLRLSLSKLKTGDIKPIIFRGGFLNLIFFTLSFIFFFLLVRLLFPESKSLQLFAMFCAFLSTAAISNTLFLRPYQIQETMFVIFCYCFVKTFGSKKYVIHDNKLYLNIKLFFILSLITAFTLLTGYYSIIFIGLFGLYAIFIKYSKQDYPEIKNYFLIFCSGLLFAQIFYPGYITGYMSGRGREVSGILFSEFLLNVTSSITAAIMELHRHFFTWPVIIVCALCLIFPILRKRKILIQKQALYIFVISMFYLLFIMYIAPYKILRYIMPVFPFLIILPAMIINSTGNRKISIAVVLLLCAVFSNSALNKNNIEYLYKNKSDEYSFTKDTDTPVFVLNKTYWKYADMVPYFNNEQRYYFIEDYQDVNLYQYNRFYLVIEKALETPEINFERFLKGNEFSTDHFIYRKLYSQ